MEITYANRVLVEIFFSATSTAVKVAFLTTVEIILLHYFCRRIHSTNRAGNFTRKVSCSLRIWLDNMAFPIFDNHPFKFSLLLLWLFLNRKIIYFVCHQFHSGLVYEHFILSLLRFICVGLIEIVYIQALSHIVVKLFGSRLFSVKVSFFFSILKLKVHIKSIFKLKYTTVSTNIITYMLAVALNKSWVCRLAF